MNKEIKEQELFRLRSERAKINHKIRLLVNPKVYFATQKRNAKGRKKKKK